MLEINWMQFSHPDFNKSFYVFATFLCRNLQNLRKSTSVANNRTNLAFPSSKSSCLLSQSTPFSSIHRWRPQPKAVSERLSKSYPSFNKLSTAITFFLILKEERKVFPTDLFSPSSGVWFERFHFDILRFNFHFSRFPTFTHSHRRTTHTFQQRSQPSSIIVARNLNHLPKKGYKKRKRNCF